LGWATSNWVKQVPEEAVRKSRTIVLALLAVGAITLGACGTTTSHGSSPAPRKLSLLEESGKSAGPALYPQQPTRYVLDGPLTNLGPEAPVLKLISHDVTTAELGTMSSALGMHATPVRTDTGWELRDGEALLTVTTSGVTSVDYTSTGGTGSSPGSVGSGSAGAAGSATSGPGNPSTGVSAPAPPVVPPATSSSTTLPLETVPSTTVPAPVDVPRADDAMNMAQALLDGLGVLNGQQWSHDVSDVGGIAVSCAPGVECSSTPSPVTARTVTYDLVVNGVQVPSVSWSVTIGEHRRVESVSGTWAQPASVGTYALRSTQNVFNDLQGGHAQYVGPQPLAATASPDATTVTTNPSQTIEVHITGVALGLARWEGLDHSQTVVYLVPTYRFHAQVKGGSPYDIELLALDPASFSIVAPPTTGGPTTSQTSSSVVPQPAPAPEPGATASGTG